MGQGIQLRKYFNDQRSIVAQMMSPDFLSYGQYFQNIFNCYGYIVNLLAHYLFNKITIQGGFPRIQMVNA